MRYDLKVEEIGVRDAIRLILEAHKQYCKEESLARLAESLNFPEPPRNREDELTTDQAYSQLLQITLDCEKKLGNLANSTIEAHHALEGK